VEEAEISFGGEAAEVATENDGDGGEDEEEEGVLGVVAEAVVFSAIERAVATMAGGGGTRFSRRDTITQMP